MKEPKKVIVSKDGTSVSVGDKQFLIRELDPAQLALIMKERNKGFLKSNKEVGQKVVSYAMAGFKVVLAGLGCWIASKFFQNVDVAEMFLKGAWLGLSTAGLLMSGKSIYYNKKRKGMIQDYEDDQTYLGMEIIKRQLQGEDTALAEKILDEIIEKEKNAQ